MNRLSHPAYIVAEKPTNQIEESLGKKIENHPDFILIQPEGESIRVEMIHQLQRRILFRPLEAERLIVLIEEADKMTETAANALLKTLEEPPTYLLFLLQTKIPEKLPITIRSRCQRIRGTAGDRTVPEEWDPFALFWREKILPSLIEKRSSFDLASKMAGDFLSEFENPVRFFPFLKAWWRDLIAYQAARNRSELVVATSNELDHLIERNPEEKIFEDWDRIIETERAIESNVLKQLAFERLFYQLGRS